MRSEIDSRSSNQLEGLKGHLILLSIPAWGMFSKPKVAHIDIQLIVRCVDNRMFTVTLRCRLQSHPRTS